MQAANARGETVAQPFPLCDGQAADADNAGTMNTERDTETHRDQHHPHPERREGTGGERH